MTKLKYDLFISYATQNKEIADYVVERIEKRGYKCFVAPRDIAMGADYASEIVKAISNSTAVVLIFSEYSDKSGYVLREVNSAVSRNKMIIPLRVENFVPSEAMEFYLGVTQWLDAYPQILDVHLDNLISILIGIQRKNCVDTIKEPIIKAPTLLTISEVKALGYTTEQIVMKELELDYVCIPPDKFVMNETIEGTPEDWMSSIDEAEEDTSILVVSNDEIIGFCDVYPVTEEAYRQLIEGQVIIRDSMIDLYELGGCFDAYIAMIAIAPEYASQKTYLMIIDWIFKHIAEWKENRIELRNIGISVYSAMLEKFMIKFGFEYRGLNPAKGKIYETSMEKLKNNALVKSRYKDYVF